VLEYFTVILTWDDKDEKVTRAAGIGIVVPSPIYSYALMVGTRA